MDISDVIGKLRETQLQQGLHLAALQSTVDMLSRFTWNLITALADQETVIITLEATDPKEESTDGDPTLF